MTDSVFALTPEYLACETSHQYANRIAYFDDQVTYWVFGIEYRTVHPSTLSPDTLFRDLPRRIVMLERNLGLFSHSCELSLTL